MRELLFVYFILGLGYAPFTDLIVLPFLVTVGFCLFSAGHMPLSRYTGRPYMGALLLTLLFFFLFALIYPASIWFSTFRSFRSIADILFIGVFLVEMLVGGIVVLLAGSWILKGNRPWRSYMMVLPMAVTLAVYCIFTAWRHHIGYTP
jgi:hypothetical protein